MRLKMADSSGEIPGSAQNLAQIPWLPSDLWGTKSPQPAAGRTSLDPRPTKSQALSP